MDDLPPKVEIGTSRIKLLVLGVLGIGMTSASGFIASGVVAQGIVGSVITWFGLIFFGLCTLYAFWRMFTARGPIVTLDAYGIRDARISGKLIPWSEICNISTWRTRGARFMILAVDPAFESSLELSRFARLQRRANRVVGANGLSVGTVDLRTNYDNLFRTACDYWERSNRSR